MVRTKQTFTSCEYEIVVYLYVGIARVYVMPPYFWQTSNAMTPFVCGATMGAFNDEYGTYVVAVNVQINKQQFEDSTNQSSDPQWQMRTTKQQLTVIEFYFFPFFCETRCFDEK